jgi:hypothetical protein
MLKSLQRPGVSAIPTKSATDQQTILVRIRAGPDPPGAARRIARARQHSRRLGPGVSKGDETGQAPGAHSGRSGGSGDWMKTAGLRIGRWVGLESDSAGLLYLGGFVGLQPDTQGLSGRSAAAGAL